MGSPWRTRLLVRSAAGIKLPAYTDEGTASISNIENGALNPLLSSFKEHQITVYILAPGPL